MLRGAILVGCLCALVDVSNRTAKAQQGDQPKTVAIDVATPAAVIRGQKIRQALGEPTTLDFKESPLSDIVAFLKDMHKIEIQLDLKALEDASIAADVPITQKVSDVSLRSALRLMLGAIDLTYVVKDEVLLITTPEKASEALVIKIYPVGDLASPGGALRGGENFRQLV